MPYVFLCFCTHCSGPEAQSTAKKWIKDSHGSPGAGTAHSHRGAMCHLQRASGTSGLLGTCTLRMIQQAVGGGLLKGGGVLPLDLDVIP